MRRSIEDRFKEVLDSERLTPEEKRSYILLWSRDLDFELEKIRKYGPQVMLKDEALAEQVENNRLLGQAALLFLSKYEKLNEVFDKSENLKEDLEKLGIDQKIIKEMLRITASFIGGPDTYKESKEFKELIGATDYLPVKRYDPKDSEVDS